jgi:hypothetical protein
MTKTGIDRNYVLLLNFRTQTARGDLPTQMFLRELNEK